MDKEKQTEAINSTDGSLNTEAQPQEQKVDSDKPVETVPYDRFKQVNERAKVAEAKLAEAEAARSAQEQREAEEAGKYKELYEKMQAEKDAAELKAKQLQLDYFKSAELTKAGFADERLEKAKQFVTGTTEDEIRQNIEVFKELLPQQNFVDPSVNAPGGAKTETKTSKDKAEEKGREAARKLFKRK